MQHAAACSLYVLDLLPLIYRYLPREGSKAPPAPPQSQDKPGEGPAELFISSLLSLVRKHRPPTHMAVAVDVPGATFRCAQSMDGDVIIVVADKQLT